MRKHFKHGQLLFQMFKSISIRCSWSKVSCQLRMSWFGVLLGLFPVLFCSSLLVSCFLLYTSLLCLLVHCITCLMPVFLLWISCIFVLYLDFASSFLDLFALLASGSSTLSYSLLFPLLLHLWTTCGLSTIHFSLVHFSQVQFEHHLRVENCMLLFFKSDPEFYQS